MPNSLFSLVADACCRCGLVGVLARPEEGRGGGGRPWGGARRGRPGAVRRALRQPLHDPSQRGIA